MPSHVAIVLTASIILASLVRLLRVGRRESDLPPGPPTRPIIGNIPDWPLTSPYLTFAKWAEKYGEIFSLKLGTGTVVSLNTPQAVRFVLDTKNMSTADRPDLYVINFITAGLHLGFMKYGNTWRILRRAATEILNSKACAKHHPIQYAESAQFMNDLLVDPQGFYDHCQRYAQSVVVAVVFGQRVARVTSWIARALANTSGTQDHLLTPGVTPPIDLVPLFKYVPERWAKWKTICRNARDAQRDMNDRLTTACEERLQNGRGNGCFIETLCERRQELGMTRDMVMYLGESLIEPGSDSTKTFLQNCIMLLVTHPEVQQKARREVDQVVGTNRLPTFEDLNDLPYCRAIVEEVNRLRPFGPLGLPHCASEDVFYKDYRIPKNTTIFINVWAIYHDKDLFDEPDTFEPERFIRSPYGVKKGIDPREVVNIKDLVFGAGRRICPGMILGRSSVMLNTARLLWGFDLLKATNPDGTPIEIDFKNCKPLSSNAPGRFQCDIRPRSPAHAQTIRREFLQASESFAEFEQEFDLEDIAFMKAARDTAEQALL
ncbi:hypothetical protein FRB99_006703 [Tulasnella sp. 403]|nr:hypothetical protein FRB99_006703 [Tulasnella sp. 403]